METKNELFAPWVERFGLKYPYGKCQCGCGMDAPISTETRKRGGVKRGEPRRFVKGHDPRKNAPGTMAPWVEKYGLQAAYGKCQCGCGENAPIAKVTALPYRLKGEPGRFVIGHSPRGQHYSKYRTLSEAFANVVAIGNEYECWDAHHTANHGYGVVHFGGKKHLAHRVAYELFVGPIPEGMFACHKCDRRLCANPNHLFLGTNQDNMDDMVSKKRHAWGKRNANYKHGRYVGDYKRRKPIQDNAHE